MLIAHDANAPSQVIKKLANSFERRPDMQLDGDPVGFEQLRDVWRVTHFDTNGRAMLKQTKLTAGHFNKNNMTRMSVKLAAQVFSNTTVDLSHVTLKAQDPAMYRRLSVTMSSNIMFCSDWNRVLDIMNSRVHEAKLGIQLINAPDHKHIIELLQASANVLRWKLQATEAATSAEERARPPRWMSREAGNDCISLGLSVAALAAVHATTLKAHPLVLRRLDQDKVENHFASVRQRGGHGGVNCQTAKRAQQVSNTAVFAKYSKSNARAAPPDATSTRMQVDLRRYMPTREDVVRESQPLFY